MKNFLLMVNILVLISLASGCETVKGMKKDVTTAGVLACKAGTTVVDAFAEGNDKKPRGVVRKADDWIKENLW